MTKNRNNVEHWQQRIVEGKPARQIRQRNIPPTCPTCGASLPHDNPMSQEYHEHVVRRSSEQEESLPGKEALWQRYNALERRYDELLRQFDMLEKRITTLEEHPRK